MEFGNHAFSGDNGYNSANVTAKFTTFESTERSADIDPELGTFSATVTAANSKTFYPTNCSTKYAAFCVAEWTTN